MRLRCADVGTRFVGLQNVERRTNEYGLRRARAFYENCQSRQRLSVELNCIVCMCRIRIQSKRGTYIRVSAFIHMVQSVVNDLRVPNNFNRIMCVYHTNVLSNVHSCETIRYTYLQNLFAVVVFSYTAADNEPIHLHLPECTEISLTHIRIGECAGGNREAHHSGQP